MNGTLLVHNASEVLILGGDGVWCGFRRDCNGLDIPGGKSHFDEDACACALRELKEEILLEDWSKVEPGLARGGRSGVS